MKKRPPSKYATGGKRMKELGYKPIQIWVDREDMALLVEASTQDRMPLTRFMLRAGLHEARRVLAERVLAARDGDRPLH